MALRKLERGNYGRKWPARSNIKISSFKGLILLCQSILKTRRITYLHGSAHFTISLITTLLELLTTCGIVIAISLTIILHKVPRVKHSACPPLAFPDLISPGAYRLAMQVFSKSRNNTILPCQAFRFHYSAVAFCDWLLGNSCPKKKPFHNFLAGKLWCVCHKILMIAIPILTLIVLLKITRIMLNLKIKIQTLHLIIILTRITITIIIINPQGLEILGWHLTEVSHVLWAGGVLFSFGWKSRRDILIKILVIVQL